MEEQKKKLRIKVLDENIFGPIVDNTFKDADINNSGFIEKNELFILLNKIRKNLDIPSATEKDVNNELYDMNLNMLFLILMLLYKNNIFLLKKYTKTLNNIL